MRKTMIVGVVLGLLAAGTAQADIRYHGSGSWDLLEGVGQDEGWQSAAAPGLADNVRANWGGNTVTLNYATAVNRMQLGVDESGEFNIQSGGTLTLTDGSTVGNNGGSAIVGTLTIDAGGAVQVNNWVKIGNKATGVATVEGLLGMTGHLWMGCHGTDNMLGTLTVQNGGIVDVGGNIGLGTVNAVDPAAGSAIVNINSGGALHMNHWADTTSIQAGSVMNINGTGFATVGGDRVDAAYAYYEIGKIASDTGGILATFDGSTTTIVGIPEPSTLALLALAGIGLAFRRRR